MGPTDKVVSNICVVQYVLIHLLSCLFSAYNTKKNDGWVHNNY